MLAHHLAERISLWIRGLIRMAPARRTAAIGAFGEAPIPSKFLGDAADACEPHLSALARARDRGVLL